MSRIGPGNTKPELVVRSVLHGMGYRFRLHVRKLPGCPDIVLARYQAVIFVHGCFWHRHLGCKYAYMPKTRKKFWDKKFNKNIARHKKVARELEKLGWRLLVIWECKTPVTEDIKNKMFLFLRKQRVAK